MERYNLVLTSGLVACMVFVDVPTHLEGKEHLRYVQGYLDAISGMHRLPKGQWIKDKYFGVSDD